VAENVKQFKDVTLTYYAPNGGTFEIETDMPGSAFALRRTITLDTVTDDRKTQTWPLDDPSLLEGKLFKPKISSTGVVILYSGFVRARLVGEYIDGGAGDVWEPQPIVFMKG
jgi:hypothetical protein